MMYDSSSVKSVFKIAAAVMEDRMEELNALDAAMGDGDLGVSLRLGFQKAYLAIADLDDIPGKLLIRAGKTMMEEAPSTLGTLFGLFFRHAGKSLGEKKEFDFPDLILMFEAGYQEMVQRGKAVPGEKTILDVLYPALESLRQFRSENLQPGERLAAMISASEEGLEKSTGMMAIHGRPAYFGKKTVGMVDGGAKAGVYFLKCVADAIG